MLTVRTGSPGPLRRGFDSRLPANRGRPTVGRIVTESVSAWKVSGETVIHEVAA